jgi:hypothetical protein
MLTDDTHQVTKVSSLQGQPQCRRNVMTVGFPFGLGSCSFEFVGAFDPITGAGDVLMAGGVFQLLSSC